MNYKKLEDYKLTKEEEIKKIKEEINGKEKSNN